MKMAEVEKALKYLADTDVAYAKSRARVKAIEYQIKTAKGIAFLQATGTVSEREAKACSSAGYREFVREFEDATIDMETYSAKRKRAELTIEVWRTETSARKVGFEV